MAQTNSHSAAFPSPHNLRSGQPEQYALLAAVLLALAIAGFDLITESAVGIGFLGLVPLVAAARGASPVQVAGTVALVTSLVIALGVPDDIFGDPLHLALIFGVLAFGLLAVYVARLRAERDLEQLRLEVQYGVAAVLQESGTLREAAPRLLEVIGTALGWEVGGLWEGRPPRSLRCVESWSAEGVDPAGFDELSLKSVLRPGVGIPGRVWEDNAVVWVRDMANEPELPRSEAAGVAGLKGAVGFPLRTSVGIVGVMEFFAREVRDPDPGLRQLLEALGSQVGEFVESQLAEEALRRSEALKTAILQSALDCVITMDHEGRVLEFNPSAEAVFGISAREAVGREMAQLIIPPDLRDAHRAGLARYLESGESDIVGRRVELRGMRSDGTEFPIELAISRIGDGPTPVFTGYIRDITRRQRADEERERLLELERVARADANRAMEQLSAILRGVADGVTAQAPDGSLVFANQRAIEALGYASVEELTRTPADEVRDRFEMYAEDGAPFPPDGLPGRLALEGAEDAEAVIRSVDTRDGTERWNRVKATPIRGEDGAVVMAINVMEDVTDLKRAEQGQRLLAEAGRVIGSSMDPGRILGRVARLAVVPWLADWCSIHTLEEDGSLALAAHAASDEEKAEALLELQRRFPAPPDAETGIPNVVRTMASELYPKITPELIESQARTPEHAELIRRAGPHSAVVVPITARGRALGAIALLRLGQTRSYGEEDLEMAEELGRRVGVAVDNARLYAERSYIAQTLQQSLLPAELPQIPGIETGARFRATGEGNDVGGDFYDLFEAAGGGWSVVVGDVCGKGPDAAAVTALARYTLRAAAMRDPAPSGRAEDPERGAPAPAHGPALRHRGLRIGGPGARRGARVAGQRRASAAAAAARGRHRGGGRQAGHAGRRGARPRPGRRVDPPAPGRRARVLHRRRDRGPRCGRDPRRGPSGRDPGGLRRP